jgi:predicted transcriptional regulator
MHSWEQTLYAVVNPDENLGTALSGAFDELNVSVPEFSEESGLSESLLYKITSGHRTNIQLNNFRSIIQGLKRLEQGRTLDERYIALISNREALEHLRNRYSVDGFDVVLREYPSSTVEEAIRQSIIAERDGVDAIVCGPITAYTIEEIVYTPVIGLDITNKQIKQAIELAVKKTVPEDDD